MQEKVYLFGNEGNSASNNLLTSILPTLQNRGVDTGYLLGMLNDRNGRGVCSATAMVSEILLLL